MKGAMLKRYGPTFFALLRKPWLWGVLIVLALGVPLLMYVADKTRAEFLQNLDAVAAEKLAINVGYMQSQIENLRTPRP
ncbi:MAG: hypothetical protein VR64_06255 [Desulfatitalea sp. BRH_c12]|nr:MAG: hypothetical protein VR64_06255 [Desulfatitalea sp. BRH_c12]